MKSDSSDWEIVGEQVGSGSFGVTYRCKKSIQIDDVEIVTQGLIKLLKPSQYRQSYKEEFASFLEEIRALWSKAHTRFK